MGNLTEEHIPSRYYDNEYWREVQRTRCPVCGGCLGVHDNDCPLSDMEGDAHHDE